MILLFDRNAVRFLKKLDRKIKMRIMNKLEEAKNQPEAYFVRLKGVDFWKLRIGNYRVIAAIDKNRIRILKIGPRKNVYRRLK